MRSRPRPPRVYAIADAQALGTTPISRAAALMAEAGIGWVQVRAKTMPDRSLYRELEATCRVLEGSGVELWIDDRADLAALFPLAGVHLGQRDLPPHEDTEVDVVAVGPVYSTTGKEHPDPVVGLDLVRTARRLTTKPLVAIGGIDDRRIGETLAAGADCVAVLGAACRGDVLRDCRRLVEVAQGRS